MSLTEDEIAGERRPFAIMVAPEMVELLESVAREVAACRELCELLVDWAGARDRPAPADAQGDGAP